MVSGDDKDGLDLTKQPHSFTGYARRFFKTFRYTFLFASWIMSWLVVLGILFFLIPEWPQWPGPRVSLGPQLVG